jgi:hypothetical protein
MAAVVSKTKLLQLFEMQPVAKEATYSALKAYMPPSDEDKKSLTLGAMLTDEAGIFELYLPADRPQDAKVISRASVNRVTGEVTVEVFLPRSAADGR